MIFQSKKSVLRGRGVARRILTRTCGLKSKIGRNQPCPKFLPNAKIGLKKLPSETKTTGPISCLKLRSRSKILSGKRSPTSPTLAENASTITLKFGRHWQTPTAAQRIQRHLEDNRTLLKPPPPFDSWFEVDTALELTRKGFTVLPQHKVANRRIDLVVAGGARLAVECDGDTWQGAERYEEDLHHQRQLERYGWEFFRVRASISFLRQQRSCLREAVATARRKRHCPDKSRAVMK